MSSKTVHDDNRAALQSLMQATGLRPRRSSGQNFLVDRAAVEALIKAADVGLGETVLEIGPGFGAVTDELVSAGAEVKAVELDRRLAAYLRERWQRLPKVQIIEGDIFSLDLSKLVTDGEYKLVASLPFNITSLVLRNFIELPPRPTKLALIVQKEVAERVMAPPGRMSLLSVAVQYLGSPSLISLVPRTAFWPEPEVDAAILRIAVKPLPDQGELRSVLRLARIGFSSRRKMLQNNLRVGLRRQTEEVISNLQQAGLAAQCRAQDLTVANWSFLAKKLL